MIRLYSDGRASDYEGARAGGLGEGSASKAQNISYENYLCIKTACTSDARALLGGRVPRAGLKSQRWLLAVAPPPLIQF